MVKAGSPLSLLTLSAAVRYPNTMLERNGFSRFVLRIGVTKIKLARRGINVIAPFRDGQRYNLGIRARHPVDYRPWIIASHHEIH